MATHRDDIHLCSPLVGQDPLLRLGEAMQQVTVPACLPPAVLPTSCLAYWEHKIVQGKMSRYTLRISIACSTYISELLRARSL